MDEVVMREMTQMTERSRGKEKRTVLVLGATGLVGGAVARALLSFPWFQVSIGTRRPWCSEALLLQRAGAKVLEVDFNYKQSLLEAMIGIKCVFLHTHYWEMYSRTLEVWHGQSVVEAAVAANVEHIVYDGTTYVKPSDGRMCGFLTSRLEIEDIIVRSGISYTIVVFPFVLENLLTVFRPFEVSANLYALPLPMEGSILPVGGLNDMAICVCKIILQLRNVRRIKLFLASQLVTVQQIASTLTSVIRVKRFFDPELSVEDFMAFEFPGSKDLATMFLHYQNDFSLPDIQLTRSLNPRLRNITDWMEDNRSIILRVLSEPKEVSSVDTLLSPTDDSMSICSQTPSINVTNSAAVSVWAMSLLKTRRSLGHTSDPSSTSPNSPPRDVISPRRTGASTKKRWFLSVSDSNLKESGLSSINHPCGTWLLSGGNVGESNCNHLDSSQFDSLSLSGVTSTSLPSDLSLVSFEHEEQWSEESQQTL